MDFSTGPATAADYRWIRDPGSVFRRLLEHGYTLTLVRGPVTAGALAVPGEGGEWALDLRWDVGAEECPPLLDALCAGSRAVSHAQGGGELGQRFSWYEDGRLRTAFAWPTDRSGTTPDALNDVLAEVGFDLTDDDDLVGGFTVGVDPKAALFALTERLTGVRMTEELLARSAHRTGDLAGAPPGM
ncbi:hypothetical protein GCM10010329_53020 [Streptomyces spiroverticillatus]|uniref:Uncharacterized protein n=1 Tax=Streptomyces finlayi TaxID=67296 RepID=A0A918X1Z1_9ACTN|nr:DUF6461 domain-containing protein [Streptomyces finlayi]GHA23010.1 hypothetical protein GCM10010329_53020 [Streptomyces spiroverticillatus]GHD04703.1 hypothetical protein GCM10010334_53950 [Streptomyces finlayi]